LPAIKPYPESQQMVSVSKGNLMDFLVRLPALMIGLFLFAVGVVANLNSGLGMSPWGVLNVGVSNITPLTLGQASQVIGLVVIAVGWALGFAPGFGTLMNMYFIGLFIDLIVAWGLIPIPTEPIFQYLLLILSVAILGVGSLFYMGVQLGAGPRDGLMLGLVKKLDKQVAYVRAGIEGTVLVLGYLLGGPVGIGTVITALTTGYSVQLFFRLGGFDSKSKQLDLYELYKWLSGRSDRP
jgi:uncharacterized membrane protein YczE